MTLACMKALPNIIGGKRELAPLIFHEAAAAGFPPAQGHALVDAFSGGGSIALAGKALGYAVQANDTAIRAELVGRALLENDRVMLDEADLELALEHEPGWLPPVRDFPFTDRARELFARIIGAAAEHPSPVKAALLRLVVFKAAQRMAPYSQPNAAGTAAAHIRRRNFDALSEYDRRYNVPRFTRPRSFLDQSLRDLKAGVFTNGERNTFTRGDALDFIGFAEGDVLYLDPPYPGTKVYETHYQALDSLLEGRAVEAEPSRFSAKDGWLHIDALLTAGEHFPVWIVSLGDASVEVEVVEDMLHGHGRDVRVRSVHHKHLTGTSSAEHRATNKELVIVATKPTT